MVQGGRPGGAACPLEWSQEVSNGGPCGRSLLCVDADCVSVRRQTPLQLIGKVFGCVGNALPFEGPLIEEFGRLRRLVCRHVSKAETQL